MLHNYILILLLLVIAVTCNHTPCDTARQVVIVIFRDLTQDQRDQGLKEAINNQHKKIIDPQKSTQDKMCYQAIKKAYELQMGNTEPTPFKCEEACRLTFDIIT